MTQKVYFKGINGLRAFAALAVVVFHLNMSLHYYRLPLLRSIDLAGFGVTIFFAISGFLITFLLLKERELGRIDVPKFYMRRILRIWPLYFLFLGLSLLTAYCYHIGELPGSLPYYLLFAANVPFILDTALPFLGHYWSLGVEEQFYIFWPWLIRGKYDLLKAVGLFAILFFALRVLFRFIEYRWGYHLPYLAIQVTRFDCMAIGGIGAILFHRQQARFLGLMMHPVSQLISWLVIVLLLFNRFHTASVIDQELVAVVTVCLIINLSSNPKTLVRLDYPVFDFLGKISYGIYVVHQLIIFYFAKLVNPLTLPLPAKYMVIYSGVIGLTIVVAWLSYTFFETRFLALKDRYSIVKSSIAKTA